jgi:hypothetical protein
MLSLRPVNALEYYALSFGVQICRPERARMQGATRGSSQAARGASGRVIFSVVDPGSGPFFYPKDQGSGLIFFRIPDPIA